MDRAVREVMKYGGKKAGIVPAFYMLANFIYYVFAFFLKAHRTVIPEELSSSWL